MEQVKSKKKGIIIAGISAIVLIAVLGISFAYWAYSRTTDNQILVAGDIYMKYTEPTLSLSIPNAMPSNGPDETRHFDFTIEGRNKYSKPIWYEIVLSQGEEEESKTRLKDEFLRFRLVEIKGEERKVVADNVSYSDLTEGQKIWVNTIPANTTDNIEIKYELYMWIAFETKIGNTKEGNDYTIDEWKDVYASVRVSVNGDFNEKKVSVLATKKIKDTLGQTGGVVGVTNEGEPIKEKSSNIRDYRYSGLNVNNYIYFNCEADATEKNASSKCELWRILGVFMDENKNEYVKIVRNKTLEETPSSYTVGTTTYSIGSSGRTYWNFDRSYTYDGDVDRYGSTNDWSRSGLQNWLNSKGNTDGYLKKLSSGAQNMIVDFKLYLGNVLASSDDQIGTVNEIYLYERAVNGCENNIGPLENQDSSSMENNNECRVWANNAATWSGKIGLLYPSDWGYAVETENWNGLLENSNPSWLYSSYVESNNGIWLLSPTASLDSWKWYGATVLDMNGKLTGDHVNDGDLYNVLPTLYLNSQVMISDGDGSEATPYFLEKFNIDKNS